MGELSIEEKAARYDRSIERARDVYTYYCDDREQLRKIESIFPELKESESKDEKIRKGLIEGFQQYDEEECWRDIKYLKIKDILAYLKKKVKNNMGISEATKKKLEDNLNKALEKETPESWNEFLEEQGKQKYIPKHKVGDTIYYNSFGEIKSMIVAEVFTDSTDNPMYEDENGSAVFEKDLIEQNPTDNVLEEEKPLFKKFTRAVYDCAWEKITCKVEGESREEYANRWAEQLLTIVKDWADNYIDFTVQQKLRKGYNKWKEDTIEENSSSWSEEDERIYKVILELIDSYSKGTIGGCIISPNTDRYIKWFKSIKDRILLQPEQEWSEEDENRINNLCHFLEEYGDQYYGHLTLQGIISRLKSLKPQKQWKPSDEQIGVIEALINNRSFQRRHLDSLYEQLKKLKSE